MGNHFEFENLVTSEEIEHLTHSFAKCTDMPCNIVLQPNQEFLRVLDEQNWRDPNAKLSEMHIDDILHRLPETGEYFSLIIKANLTPFCECLRKNKLAKLRCLCSDMKGARDAFTDRGAKLYKCHIGLNDIVAPICVGDYHAANLFVGQIRDEDVLLTDKIEKFIGEYNLPNLSGLSFKHILKLYKDLPQFSEDRLEQTMKFMMELADLISTKITERAARQVFRDAWIEAQSSRTINGLVKIVLSKLQNLINYDYALVFIKDDKQSGIFHLIYSDLGEIDTGNAHIRWETDKSFNATSREGILRIESHEFATYLPDLYDKIANLKIKTAAVIPIKGETGTIGSIELFSTKKNALWVVALNVISSYTDYFILTRVKNAEMRNVLHQILSKSDVRSTLFNCLVKTIPDLIRVNACSIYMKDGNDPLSAHCVATTASDACKYDKCSVGEGLVGMVLLEGKPLQYDRIADVAEKLTPIDLPWEIITSRAKEKNDTTSMNEDLNMAFIALPINYQTRTVGVIKTLSYFPISREEKDILSNVADLLGMQDVERLKLLRLIAWASVITEDNTDRQNAYALLTLITHGQGLSINRAMLFKHDYLFNRSECVLAVGPLGDSDCQEQQPRLDAIGNIEDCLNNSEWCYKNVIMESLHKYFSGKFYYLENVGCALSDLIFRREFCIHKLNFASEVHGDFQKTAIRCKMDKATICIMPMNDRISYYLICDNPYNSNPINESTENLMRFVCTQYIKSTKARLKEEDIIKARISTFKAASRLALHLFGSKTIQANKKIESLLRERNLAKIRAGIYGVMNILHSTNTSLKAFAKNYTREVNYRKVTIDQFVKDLKRHLSYCEDLMAYTITTECKSNCVIEVDLDQILSCFDMFVKNSYQHRVKGRVLEFNIVISDVKNLLEMKVKNAVLSPNMNYLSIAIADTGEGVPYKIKEDIFKPFYSTHREGTGIGLAFVYDTITNHNGVIWEEGEFGTGAFFRLLLPMSSIERE